MKLSHDHPDSCELECKKQQACLMWTHDNYKNVCFLYSHARTFDQDWDRAQHNTAGCVRKAPAKW